MRCILIPWDSSKRVYIQATISNQCTSSLHEQAFGLHTKYKLTLTEGK